MQPYNNTVYISHKLGHWDQLAKSRCSEVRFDVKLFDYRLCLNLYLMQVHAKYNNYYLQNKHASKQTNKK